MDTSEMALTRNKVNVFVLSLTMRGRPAQFYRAVYYRIFLRFIEIKFKENKAVTLYIGHNMWVPHK